MKFTALAMIPALFLTLLVVLLESVSLAIPAMLFSLMWASWIATSAVVALYWAARIARYAFRKNGTPQRRGRQKAKIS
jgi:hypothetical protein